VLGQPFGRVGPRVVGVHQGVHVEVQPQALAQLGGLFPSGRPLFRGVLRRVQVERLDRDLAARRAVGGDQVEEPVLGLAGEIRQQAFGQPGGRLHGIEASGDQRRGPVIAKINGHRDAARLGRRTMGVQRRGLVAEHLRLVDLENGGARGPVQAVGARIQPSGQDDDLADTGADRGVEVAVEVVGAHGLVVAGHFVQPPGVLVAAEPLVPAGHSGPRRACRGGQQIGVLVADQRVGSRGFCGSRGRDAQRRRAHTLGDVPAVAVRADEPHLTQISHFVCHAI
jgi:hypothetical protein